MSVVVTLNLEYVADCAVSQLNEDEHNAFVDVQHLLSQPQYRNFVMTQSKTTSSSPSLSDEFAHWRPNLLRVKQEIMLGQNGGSSTSAQKSGVVVEKSMGSGSVVENNDRGSEQQQQCGDPVGVAAAKEEDEKPRRRRSSRGMLMLERRSSLSPAPRLDAAAPAVPLSAASSSDSSLASNLVRERSSPLLTATRSSPAVAVLARERSSPVLARERSLVLDQSPLRRSQKRCVEYVGDATRMHAFARDLGKVFVKYAATLRATVSTGTRIDRDDPLSPRTLELLPPSSSSSSSAKQV